VTGGTAVDSAILLRRIQEISTTLSEEHDTLICNPNDRFGKLYSSHTLARYCADLIQLPTQTTGGKTGRILSVSSRFFTWWKFGRNESEIIYIHVFIYLY
jgi:hypothetical protein